MILIGNIKFFRILFMLTDRCSPLRSKRKRSTKKGAIKRKGKASRIKKKRAKSMKKRARFGLK